MFPHRQKQKFILTLLVGILTLLALIVLMRSKISSDNSVATRINAFNKLIEQRNEISKLLNLLKQEYGKVSCENLQLKSKLGEKTDLRVSAFGGWCKSTGLANSTEHAFDRKLAEALSEYLISRRVASFGEGPGAYKHYIDATQRLQLYDAYDGAPYGPETSDGKVKFLDLTAPQYGLPSYDWIVSLEVAEHIPAKFEGTFIDNIARHAREGIILSWAVPGQNGLAHVNNRPLDYVIDILSKKGFIHDKTDSEMLQKQSTLVWLRANVNVYKRKKHVPLNELNL